MTGLWLSAGGNFGGRKKDVTFPKGQQLVFSCPMLLVCSTLKGMGFFFFQASAVLCLFELWCLVPTFPGSVLADALRSGAEGALLSRADEDRVMGLSTVWQCDQTRVRGQFMLWPESRGGRDGRGDKLNAHPGALWSPPSSGKFHEWRMDLPLHRKS